MKEGLTRVAQQVIRPMYGRVLIFGSIASVVGKDFVEDPAYAYRWQRQRGFLSRQFWTDHR
ncbi:MAG TPA: hypothetical protein VMT96_00535 [Candidatus Bathyarchaeia archaeon]|nr:hypothetical protein [Candidatus Bathyarchaeia archaeon]